MIPKKNGATAATVTPLRIQSAGGTQMLEDQHITLPGVANTYPQRLRKIAEKIDSAEHCTLAAELREIARGLSSSTGDLLQQVEKLDGFWQVESALDRASIIGSTIGAIRIAATNILGFEVAHADTKAVA